jgi:hypothetical protein
LSKLENFPGEKFVEDVKDKSIDELEESNIDLVNKSGVHATNHSPIKSVILSNNDLIYGRYGVASICTELDI